MKLLEPCVWKGDKTGKGGEIFPPLPRSFYPTKRVDVTLGAVCTGRSQRAQGQEETRCECLAFKLKGIPLLTKGQLEALLLPGHRSRQLQGKVTKD